MNKVILLVISILFGICIFFIYRINNKIDNIIVIDIIKVVNEFKMKKDLESKVEMRLHGYDAKLDSFKTSIEKINLEDEKVKDVINNYRQLQLEAQNAYETSNKSINEQIWKRLNPLIDEFGKENRYKLVIGANGMGTVLYKDNSIDKTKELINYINRKYENGD